MSEYIQLDSSFEPVLWPETKLPDEADSYAECEICTSKSRIVWGEGNPLAPVVVILDNPGAREDRDGNPFVCGTRQTLQAALQCSGLSANDVYLTYLLKCRPLRQYNKDMVRAFSKPFLTRQIDAIAPKLIMCLGDVVVQTMFDDKNAHVKDLRGMWHCVLGYPGLVSYHPLAIRKRPNLAPQFAADWGLLANALRGV